MTKNTAASTTANTLQPTVSGFVLFCFGLSCRTPKNRQRMRRKKFANGVMKKPNTASAGSSRPVLPSNSAPLRLSTHQTNARCRNSMLCPEFQTVERCVSTPISISARQPSQIQDSAGRGFFQCSVSVMPIIRSVNTASHTPPESIPSIEWKKMRLIYR